LKKLSPLRLDTYLHVDTDYYRGCKTIFNSEIAALAYAERLFQTHEVWVDPDFGATESDPQGLKSLFSNGENLDKYPYNDDEGI
jgi:glycine/serine hydroxymethyltransferase